MELCCLLNIFSASKRRKKGYQIHSLNEENLWFSETKKKVKVAYHYTFFELSAKE